MEEVADVKIRVIFSLSREESRLLEAEVRASGRSLSDLIRAAVRRVYLSPRREKTT